MEKQFGVRGLVTGNSENLSSQEETSQVRKGTSVPACGKKSLMLETFLVRKADLGPRSSATFKFGMRLNLGKLSGQASLSEERGQGPPS